MKNDDQSTATEHLANEQTFLAWLRTGVEVMAFGFVAIKFSLFASQVMGIILVGSGALMTLMSYFRYRKSVKQLREGRFQYSTMLLTVIAVGLFIISMVLLFCLVEAYVKKGSLQKLKNEATYRQTNLLPSFEWDGQSNTVKQPKPIYNDQFSDALDSHRAV